MQISQKNFNYLLNSTISQGIKDQKKKDKKSNPARDFIKALFYRVLPKKGYISNLIQAEEVILTKPVMAELLAIGRASEGPRFKLGVRSGETWFMNIEFDSKGKATLVASFPVGNRSDYMDREDYDRLDANADYDIDIFTREVKIEVRVES